MQNGQTCCAGLGATPGTRGRQLDEIGFALLMILVGVLIAIPGEQWAELALGVGVILLGKNLVRRAIGLRMRHAGLAIGGGALVAGLAGLASPPLPLTAIFLLGAGMVVLGSAIWELARRPGGE